MLSQVLVYSMITKYKNDLELQWQHDSLFQLLVAGWELSSCTVQRNNSIGKWLISKFQKTYFYLGCSHFLRITQKRFNVKSNLLEKRGKNNFLIHLIITRETYFLCIFFFTNVFWFIQWSLSTKMIWNYNSNMIASSNF